MIPTRQLARLTGVVALLALVTIPVLGQSQCLNEVTGSVVSFDQAFGSVGTDITAQALQEAGISVGDLVELRMSGHVLEVPVVSELFPQLPQSLPGIIVWGNAYIGGWYRNIAADYAVALGDEVEICLVQKGGYLDEIAAREVDHVESRDECGSDGEYANFREAPYGGIAEGVLFRSSHPADGSVKSGYAHALMVQAGVQTIINVGASWNDPQMAFDNSEYYRARGNEGAVLATNIGLAVTWPHFKAELARVLRFMIDHDPPYLIHCSLGQDRAGITSAVLAALVGADLQDVIDDYALTFVNYYRITPDHTLYPEIVEQLMSKFREMNYGDEVTDENLQRVMETYLVDEVGLSESETELLRKRLTPLSSEESEPGSTTGRSEPIAIAIEEVAHATETPMAISAGAFPELQDVLTLGEFADGNLVSISGATWQSITPETPNNVRVSADSFGHCLVLSATQDSETVSAYLAMGETDVSAYSGLYCILSSSTTMDVGLKLNCWDDAWPSGMRDAYAYETVEQSEEPHLLAVPFTHFFVPQHRRGDCPECEIRFDPARFFNTAILTDSSHGELRLYEVGFYKALSRTELPLPNASASTARRGMNVGLQLMDESNLDTLAYDWNANLLRVCLGLSGWCPASVVPRDLSDPCCEEAELLQLDWLVDECEERGMRVLIDVHQFPGYYFLDGFQDDRLWSEQAFQDALVSFWRTIAARYADRGDVIYGYDLLNEPHGVEIGEWLALANRIIEAIREVDSKHPVVIEATDYSVPSAFGRMIPVNDDNAIYSVHFYEPHAFTEQGIHRPFAGGLEYPSREWDKDWLRGTLQAVRNFQLMHGARILVGEFGVDSLTPPESRTAYLRDVLEVFEEYGFDYTYWVFKQWGAYSFEHEGRDDEGFDTGVIASYVGNTETLAVFKEFLALNGENRGPKPATEQHTCLFDESHWSTDPVLSAQARDLAWRLDGMFEVSAHLSGQLGESVLTGIDLLVTGAPYGRSYTRSESEAILKYVSDGGLLLLYAGSLPPLPASRVNSLNLIAAPLGIRYASQPSVLSMEANWTSPHPTAFFAPIGSDSSEHIDLSEGYYYLFCATSLTVSDPAISILSTGDGSWLDLDWDRVREPNEPSCPCVVIAIAEYGVGRAAILADQSFQQPCNWVTLKRVVAWLLERS